MTRQETLALAKPILFNTDMTIAILENRKTKTRRVMKPQLPGNTIETHHVDPIGYLMFKTTDTLLDGWSNRKARYCKGDLLYVRETWTCMRDIDTGHRDYFYAANKKDFDTVSSTYLCDDDGFDTGKPFPWKPSIHMPKEIARIFLRVTDVRAERLQDITAEDCAAEGISVEWSNEMPKPNYMSLAYAKMSVEPAFRDKFSKLWDSTIHPRDNSRYGWAANPWVWVYSFERVEVTP